MNPKELVLKEYGLITGGRQWNRKKLAIYLQKK
jgi:hypothetical protein